MKIPFIPTNKIVDEDLCLTDRWKLMLINLLDTLRGNLSDEGFVLPSLPTSKINLLLTAKDNTLIVDSTLNVLKIKLNGTFKTIQVL